MLVAVRDGEITAQGIPDEVVTEAMVRDVFGIDCRVITDPVTGAPLVIPVGKVKKHRANHAAHNGHYAAEDIIVTEAPQMIS
jgi:iron complex transport system ATP-binding protein